MIRDLSVTERFVLRRDRNHRDALEIVASDRKSDRCDAIRCVLLDEFGNSRWHSRRLEELLERESFHKAAGYVFELLDQLGTDPLAGSPERGAAIMCCLGADKYYSRLQLLDKYFDITENGSNRLSGLVTTAAAFGSTRCLKLLIARGADPMKASVIETIYGDVGSEKVSLNAAEASCLMLAGSPSKSLESLRYIHSLFHESPGFPSRNRLLKLAHRSAAKFRRQGLRERTEFLKFLEWVSINTSDY